MKILQIRNLIVIGIATVLSVSLHSCTFELRGVDTPFGGAEVIHIGILEDLPAIVKELASQPRDEAEKRICKIIAALKENEENMRAFSSIPGLPSATANQLEEIADHFRRLHKQWQNTAQAIGIDCP